jgi:serine/threonine-protein kinase
VTRASGSNVALKVLPDAVAHDRDRLARFTREAQALAALNHPNIAQIYGLEDVDARSALVLELIEGPTLADRLIRGALSLDEALPIASQIAQALEAAHDAGIVHRDLKPANIKITPAGTVKVLDFGLAKIFVDDGVSREVSLSPTMTAAGTRAGVIVGTAAYMSPEQARGAQVDKRADVWAFGCVLFEMLSGRTAFGADTVPDTVVRVLTLEPDLQALPRRTSPALVSLLKRCLQKDPWRRLRDIAMRGYRSMRSPMELPPARALAHARERSHWFRCSRFWPLSQRRSPL